MQINYIRKATSNIETAYSNSFSKTTKSILHAHHLQYNYNNATYTKSNEHTIIIVLYSIEHDST